MYAKIGEEGEISATKVQSFKVFFNLYFRDNFSFENEISRLYSLWLRFAFVKNWKEKSKLRSVVSFYAS